MVSRTVSPVCVNGLFLCGSQQVVSRPFRSVSSVEKKDLDISPTLLPQLNLMVKEEPYLYLTIHIESAQSYHFWDPGL